MTNLCDDFTEQPFIADRSKNKTGLSFKKLSFSVMVFCFLIRLYIPVGIKCRFHLTRIYSPVAHRGKTGEYIIVLQNIIILCRIRRYIP